ncbi:hypothetical protein MRX96_041256 [Rhipicephalus microplus]
MGGTSSINSMNFVRGSRHDFDNWANEYNATGWNYTNVLENFKAIENFNISTVPEEQIKKYHGKSGETPINYPGYNTSLSYAFLNACNESNYDYVDYNGQNHTGFMNAIAMVQPKSRGTVKLNSTHPDESPLIDLQFLSEKDDVDKIVNGTLKLMKLFNTTAMKKIGAQIWNKSYPNCENETIWTKKYVECFVRQAAFPGQHVCCTCPMGDRNDSVVDSKLKVKGLKNVRVMDASVMPKIPAGNINAAVMMIADKGAKMLLDDYRHIIEAKMGIQSG